MNDRKALVLAWLEGEGERLHRSFPPLAAAKDPAVRGWVQVSVCAIGGALTAAVLVCWLVRGWEETNQMTAMNQLRLEGLRIAVGDPNRAAWWKEEGASARRSEGDFGALLCFRVFAFAFGTVIGAMFLCAGCLLYNKMAGEESPNRVPELRLDKAMIITFVAALVNAIPGFRLLSALVALLVMATIISALLPTTFARGILVSLCYLLVGLSVVVVLAAIFGALYLVLPRLRGF